MSAWHRAMRVFVHPRVFVLLPYPGMTWVPCAQQYRPQTPTLLGQRHSQESALQSQVSRLYLCILSQQTRVALHSPLKAGLGSSVWTHLGSSIDTTSCRVWPGSRNRHSFLRDPKLGNSWASVPQFKTKDTVHALEWLVETKKVTKWGNSFKVTWTDCWPCVRRQMKRFACRSVIKMYHERSYCVFSVCKDG